MTWPYRFIFDLTPEELTHRRHLLDSYGQVAQYSVLVPLLLLQVTFALRHLIRAAGTLTTAERKTYNRARNAQPASRATSLLDGATKSWQDSSLGI